MRKTFLGLTFLLFAPTAFCAELLVPSQYSTIQSAIEAAVNGDTVIVSPGIYEGLGNTNIDFIGKKITVRGADPNNQEIVETTVIDCNGSGRGFYFHSGEDTNASVEGLTITDGNISFGGAINVQSSCSPVIRNCVISNNSSTSYGGGIFSAGSATVIGCTITGNHAFANGGAINCEGSSNILTIIDCNISDNTANIYGGGIFRSTSAGSLKINNSLISGNSSSNNGGALYISGIADIKSTLIIGNFSQSNGGGVYISNNSSTRLTAEGCTFADNDANALGGGVFSGGSSCYFSGSHSIFWDNSDSGGTGSSTAQIKTPSANWAGLLFCCIQDSNPNDEIIPFGGTDKGNIDDNPMFVREPNDGGDGWGVGDNDDYGDLHLLPDSPCIEAGNPLYVHEANATDIDDQPRVMGLVADMGADEYGPITVVTRPVDGEVWATGSRHLIKWVGSVNSVDILLSTNNGLSWQTIASDITDANSYLWTLPSQILSNQCLISVLPADGDSNAICVESGLFTIWPYPSLPPVPPSLIGKLPAPDLSQNAGPQLGCVKWIFETAGPVSSQVAVTRPYWDGYGLYIGCEDGNIYALDDFGELIWSYDINTPIVGSPAVGYYWMVYVAGQNGWLYAIDDYGQVRWTHKTDGPVYSSPVVGYDGKIYVCSQDGIIYALAPDGSELWTFKTNGPENLDAPIFATPAIDKAGAVYIAGLYDPNLYALDANTGALKWVCSFAFERDPWDPNIGQPFAAPAIGPDGTIYQTLVNDPNLYAIDPCDGGILWSTYLRQGSDTNASGWSSPVVGPDGSIYVCLDDPYLRAVSPDGQIQWVTRLGAVGGFTLSVDRNGLIYAASDDNYVCVVNAAGVELSHFEGNDWITFPAIAEDGTLIVSDTNNRVWAITDTPCQAGESALHWIADLQLNWKVDFIDFALMANDWLQCSDPANLACDDSGAVYKPGDIDRSYYVDYEDIAAFSNLWLMETGL